MVVNKWKRPTGVSGPLRALNDALHRLREEADHVPAAKIAKLMEKEGLPLSRSNAHRLFTSPRLPKRSHVLAIARALAPLTAPPRPKKEEERRFLALWKAAAEQAEPPEHHPSEQSDQSGRQGAPSPDSPGHLHGPAPAPAGQEPIPLDDVLHEAMDLLRQRRRELDHAQRENSPQALRTLMYEVEDHGEVLHRAKEELSRLRQNYRNQVQQRLWEKDRAMQKLSGQSEQLHKIRSVLHRLRTVEHDIRRKVRMMALISEFDQVPFRLPAARPRIEDGVPEAVPLPPLVPHEEALGQVWAAKARDRRGVGSGSDDKGLQDTGGH